MQGRFLRIHVGSLAYASVSWQDAFPCRGRVPANSRGVPRLRVGFHGDSLRTQSLGANEDLAEIGTAEFHMQFQFQSHRIEAFLSRFDSSNGVDFDDYSEARGCNDPAAGHFALANDRSRVAARAGRRRITCRRLAGDGPGLGWSPCISRSGYWAVPQFQPSWLSGERSHCRCTTGPWRLPRPLHPVPNWPKSPPTALARTEAAKRLGLDGAAERSSRDPSEGFKLNYFEARWSTVLKDLAEATGTELVADRFPSRPYTRLDRRPYSHAEALRILNKDLEKYGQRLLLKQRHLVLVDALALRTEYPRPVAGTSPLGARDMARRDTPRRDPRAENPPDSEDQSSGSLPPGPTKRPLRVGACRCDKSATNNPLPNNRAGNSQERNSRVVDSQSKRNRVAKNRLRLVQGMPRRSRKPAKSCSNIKMPSTWRR